MCKPERIAECAAFAADVCDHGVVTLSIGPVSIRLQRDDLASLHTFLGQARRNAVLREEHGPAWRERFPPQR